jgi:hypothetical protein
MLYTLNTYALLPRNRMSRLINPELRGHDATQDDRITYMLFLFLRLTGLRCASEATCVIISWHVS